MYGAGRDATRRPTRLRGTTAWARGADAFRRWADTFVSAGAAVRRGAPSIDRRMTQFPCFVSAAPRVDAKALLIFSCCADDAPGNSCGSPPLGLRVSDARGLSERPPGCFDDAGPRAPHLESEEASLGDAWPYPSVGGRVRP